MKIRKLKKIVEDHQHWLNRDCKGWESMKANLAGEELYGLDLHEANLAGAELIYTDLCQAQLCNANLSDAEIVFSDLKYANLFYSKLYNANLKHVDLILANLFNADLSSAVLVDVDLAYSDLSKSKMTDIFISQSTCTRLIHTKGLSEIIDFPYIPMICPEEGSFIGYKLAKYKVDDSNYYARCIVKLEIPEDAKRSSAATRKCRCNKAKVLDIIDLYPINTVGISEAVSLRDDTFIYKIGETVSVEDFNENRWEECSTGIHFFMSKQEVIEYNEIS